MSPLGNLLDRFDFKLFRVILAAHDTFLLPQVYGSKVSTGSGAIHPPYPLSACGAQYVSIYDVERYNS